MSSKARKRVNAACRQGANATRFPSPLTSRLFPSAWVAILPSIAGTEFVSKHWVEDIDGEDGYYQIICAECGRHFMGAKGRMRCKVCATPEPTQANHRSPFGPF